MVDYVLTHLVNHRARSIHYGTMHYAVPKSVDRHDYIITSRNCYSAWTCSSTKDNSCIHIRGSYRIQSLRGGRTEILHDSTGACAP